MAGTLPLDVGPSGAPCASPDPLEASRSERILRLHEEPRLPFWFATARRFTGMDPGPPAAIRPFFDRLGERPACRRVMALAGPDVTG